MPRIEYEIAVHPLKTVRVLYDGLEVWTMDEALGLRVRLGTRPLPDPPEEPRCEATQGKYDTVRGEFRTNVRCKMLWFRYVNMETNQVSRFSEPVGFGKAE